MDTYTWEREREARTGSSYWGSEIWGEAWVKTEAEMRTSSHKERHAMGSERAWNSLSPGAFGRHRFC